MSPSALSTALFIAGILVALIAVALWARAWRGHATSWGSCCRRCGFRLEGLNPTSTACPECGLDLRAAAALRPIARRNEPLRWGQAAVATLLAASLLWLGQGPTLVRSGRWICARLPDGLLIDALRAMPIVAAGAADARLQSGGLDAEQTVRLVRTAAEIAVANPEDRAGAGARILSTLAHLRQVDPALVAEALRRTLDGVQPVAGTPRPCRPGGALILTATLPATQPASWITRAQLRLSIESVSVRAPDGTLTTLEPLTGAGRAGSREFDGAAFRAPPEAGVHAAEMRVRLRQPDGTFEREALVSVQVRVVDPDSVQVTFVADAHAASLLRGWLEKASTAVDAAGTGLLVSLPRDFSTLQEQPTAIAGALQIVQGGTRLEVGRIWIDETFPTIALSAAPMPATLDRTRPATLRYTPDRAFATGVASSNCTALGDTVEVPVSLPPPPPSTPPAGTPISRAADPATP